MCKWVLLAMPKVQSEPYIQKSTSQSYTHTYHSATLLKFTLSPGPQGPPGKNADNAMPLPPHCEDALHPLLYFPWTLVGIPRSTMCTRWSMLERCVGTLTHPHDTILYIAMSCALTLFSFEHMRRFTHCGRKNAPRLAVVYLHVCTLYTYLSFHHLRIPIDA